MDLNRLSFNGGIGLLYKNDLNISISLKNQKYLGFDGKYFEIFQHNDHFLIKLRDAIINCITNYLRVITSGNFNFNFKGNLLEHIFPPNFKSHKKCRKFVEDKYYGNITENKFMICLKGIDRKYKYHKEFYYDIELNMSISTIDGFWHITLVIQNGTINLNFLREMWDIKCLSKVSNNIIMEYLDIENLAKLNYS